MIKASEYLALAQKENRRLRKLLLKLQRTLQIGMSAKTSSHALEKLDLHPTTLKALLLIREELHQGYRTTCTVLYRLIDRELHREQHKKKKVVRRHKK